MRLFDGLDHPHPQAGRHLGIAQGAVILVGRLDIRKPDERRQFVVRCRGIHAPSHAQ